MRPPAAAPTATAQASRPGHVGFVHREQAAPPGGGGRVLRRPAEAWPCDFLQPCSLALAACRPCGPWRALAAAVSCGGGCKAAPHSAAAAERPPAADIQRGADWSREQVGGATAAAGILCFCGGMDGAIIGKGATYLCGGACLIDSSVVCSASAALLAAAGWACGGPSA